MNKFIAFFAAFVLTAANFTMAFADTKTKVKQPVNDLIALLPASDAVAVGDLRRLLTDALPQIFAQNPQKLAEINALIDDFKAKTGIDARQFERVAISVKYNRISATEIDFAPVAVTRGNFNAGGLLAVAKIALKGKFREEKIGDKSLLVVSLGDVAAQLPKPPDAAKADRMAKLMAKLTTGEVGFVSADANTLVFGDLKQVRTMFANKGKNAVSADLITLVGRNPNAVLSFAGNVPQNAAVLFRLDNDEIGRILSSMTQTFGSIEVEGGNASLNFGARTETAKNAQDLEATLLGLQSLGGVFLGSKKDAKSQIAARAVENLKITRSDSEVEMRINLPQSDIDKLLGGF